MADLEISPSINYLHYYFTDYNDAGGWTFDQLHELKKQTLYRQAVTARLRYARTMYNAKQESDELGMFLDEFFSPSGAAKRQAAYDEATSDSGLPSITFRGQTMRTLSSEKGQIDFAGMSNNLADQIQEFLDSLNNTVDKAISSVGDRSVIDAYREQVLSAYIQSKGLSMNNRSQWANEIIQDFLKHEGFKRFDRAFGKDQGKKLTHALSHLILLAEALPGINFGNGLPQNYKWATKEKSGTITNSSEFLKTLAGKVGGMASGLKGAVAEIAIAVGEKNAAQIVASALDECHNIVVNTSPVGSKQSSGHASFIFDPEIKEDAKPIKGASTSKRDVRVVVSKDRVAVEYGTPVKDYTYQFDSSGFISSLNVSIVDNTPFAAAAEHAFKSGSGGLTYLYHIAAAHGNGGTRRKVTHNKDSEAEKDKTIFTEADLTAEWEQAKEAVIYANILRFLAGEAQENTLFLVANNRIYNMIEIMDGISRNPESFSASYHGKGASLSRSTMVGKNKWLNYSQGVAVESLARQRSDAALSAIRTYWNSALLTVHLDLLKTLV